MKPWVRRANKEEQRVALTSLKALARSAQYVKKNTDTSVKLIVPGVKNPVDIPRKSFFLFQELITHVAEGRSVTLVHSESEVTTQQAADMLNVSRPHLVKLLETGVIPFRKMKKHRRIALEDVVSYATSRLHQIQGVRGGYEH